MMRRCAVVLALLIGVSTCADAQISGAFGDPMSGGLSSPSGGGSTEPTASATLSRDGGIPRIVVKADFGVPIAIAASARLVAKFPWHANDEAWAIVAEDTSSALADGRHTLISDLDWEGWTGDLIDVHLRVYTSEGLAYPELFEDIELDAPGDLTTIILAGTENPWVDDGTLPAIADSSDYFDMTLLDADYFRYAYMQEGTGTLAGMSDYSVNTQTRSLYNSDPYSAANQVVLWYNMEFVPTDAEVVHSAIYATNDGGANSIWSTYGRYFIARLDTNVTDLAWLDADDVTADPGRREASWDYMDLSDTTGTKWSPNLYARDDQFDYGPASVPLKADVAAGDAIVLDVTKADQAYLDMGDARVNAGYWLFAGDDDDNTRHNNGWSQELGSGCTAEPCKVMQYVTGTDEAPAFGIGRHRIPLCVMWDDCYDEQADFFEAWGPEDASLILARSNLNPFWSLADSFRIWNTDVDTMWRDGLDIVLSMRTAVPLADYVNANGEAAGFGEIARDWLHDLLPESYPDSTLALADTTDTEWADFAWNGGGTDMATMQCIRMLQEAGYRSARGYSGSAEDDYIGTGTRLCWDDHVNIFNVYPDQWAATVPDAATEADALEELLELVDKAAMDDHRAMIWWAHSDDETINSGSDHDDAVTKVASYRAAADDAPVALMTFEELISLRIAGQSPVDPSPDDTPADWLPAPSGIDSVWARQEAHVDRCWYPPFAGSGSSFPAVVADQPAPVVADDEPAADTTGPTLAAADSSYNDTLDRAIAELTSDEPCTLSYRVRENQGAYGTPVVGDTLHTAFELQHDASGLSEGDVVTFQAAGTDTLGNASADSLEVTVTVPSSGGGGEYDVTTGYVWISGNTDATQVKMLIYDGSLNLVAESPATNIAGTGQYTEVTLSSAYTVTVGQAYYCGVITDGTLAVGVNTGAGYATRHDASGTFASPPDPYTAAYKNSATLCAYWTNGSDVTLFGYDGTQNASLSQVANDVYATVGTTGWTIE